MPFYFLFVFSLQSLWVAICQSQELRLQGLRLRIKGTSYWIQSYVFDGLDGCFQWYTGLASAGDVRIVLLAVYWELGSSHSPNVNPSFMHRLSRDTWWLHVSWGGLSAGLQGAQETGLSFGLSGRNVRQRGLGQHTYDYWHREGNPRGLDAAYWGNGSIMDGSLYMAWASHCRTRVDYRGYKMRVCIWVTLPPIVFFPPE